MQIKKQLKIELNHQDILVAIRNYMLSHGQKVSDEELADVKFVNSVQSGIRATLNVTEETDTDEAEDATPTPVVKAEVKEPAKVAEPEPEVPAPVAEVEPTPEPVVEQDNSDEPGEVETSTVDDVMPSVDEAAALVAEAKAEAQVETTPVANEEEGEVPATAEGNRKSLFL